MGRVWVKAADVREGKIERLEVRLGSLPARVIDRDTAVSWMRDMHSFIAGDTGPALQLVEVDDGAWFIRTDNAAVAEDALPALPAVRA